ncbi:Uncharacterised protein [Mycobacteroides abscessus subsp. abscessus]|nr:Uncharacterised protein [Mycobacteroides abscessus subsp. abscessus]
MTAGSSDLVSRLIVSGSLRWGGSRLVLQIAIFAHRQPCLAGKEPRAGWLLRNIRVNVFSARIRWSS